MKEMIISLLKPFAEICYKFANAVSPGAAATIYILVLVALAVWVLTLKQEKPRKTGRPGKNLLLHDLRFWAVLILFLQIVIYIVFR
jgi:hypothetical protein